MIMRIDNSVGDGRRCIDQVQLTGDVLSKQIYILSEDEASAVGCLMTAVGHPSIEP